MLGRLGLGDAADAPREVAVVIALRDGVPLRDALERLGIDTAPLDAPPPPDTVPFDQIAPGDTFTWHGHVWTRATLDQALAATPDRRAHPRVVAAFLASTQRGRPATAFRWADVSSQTDAACLAEHVAPDEVVTPAEPSGTPPAPASPAAALAWTWTADRAPDLTRTVTIDAASGPVRARLVLDDDAPGGAAWHTADGERLDPDDVSRWRP